MADDSAPLVLKVIGQPVIVDPEGSEVANLRKKDIALAVYLWHSAPRRLGRGTLAALLWGDSTESRARHSLTQTLARLQKILPKGSLSVSHNDVQWTGETKSDIESALASGARGFLLNGALFCGETAFLGGFTAGEGGEDFDAWADQTRAAYHSQLVQLLDSLGSDAEKSGDWKTAIETAEAGVRLDSFAESFHRRLMRLWTARGERNRAMRHYAELKIRWTRELDRAPDPATTHLAYQIASTTRSDLSDALPKEVATHSQPLIDDGTQSEALGNLTRIASEKPIDLSERQANKQTSKARARGVGLTLAAVAFLSTVLIWRPSVFGRRDAYSSEILYPVRPFRSPGDSLIYFARGQYVWAYPDALTAKACGDTGLVDERRLPVDLQFGGVLPSVSEYPWLETAAAVTSVDDPTVYIIRGCIRRGVPTAQFLAQLVGDDPWSRVIVVPDNVLRRIPTGLSADLGPRLPPIIWPDSQVRPKRVTPAPPPFRSDEAHRKERAARIGASTFSKRIR
jgi:DNA-binding SARP family transcriptional activator